MSLKDKITSYEQAIEVPEIRRYRNTAAMARNDHFALPINFLSPRRVTSSTYFLDGQMTGGGYLPSSAWWLVREYARFVENTALYGVILGNLWTNQYHNQWAPKPNAADPMKVDFFPDAVTGMADRPVTTTMAKFLRRTSPLYTDEYIRDVDASYRAGQSSEIEIITEAAAFRDAYCAGPSSCMSHKYHIHDGDGEVGRNGYAAYLGHHPVDAYLGIDGIGLAVGRDARGKVNARCIVYTNPTDKSDKRMIRVYGDMSLEARLKRNGYDYRPLEGLALARIVLKEVEEGRFTYAAPFLDGTQGNHSGEDKFRYLIHVQGEDKLRLVSMSSGASIFKRAKELMPRLEGLNSEYVCGSGSASGMLTIFSIPVEATVYECPVTGVKLDLTKESLGATLSVWLNGREQQALASPTLLAMFTEEVRHVNRGAIRFKPEEKPPTFTNRGEEFVDDEDNRHYFGYQRLTARYYPNEQEWFKYESSGRGDRRDPRVESGEIQMYWPPGGEPFCAYKRDMFSYLTNISTDPKQNVIHTQVSHVSERDTTVKLIRLHSRERGVEVWADQTVIVRKTTTGRLVAEGYHEVTELWDGSIVFNRHVSTYRWMGMTRVPKLRETPDADIVLPTTHSAFISTVAALDYSINDDQHLFRYRTGETDWEAKLLFALFGRTGLRVRGGRLVHDRYGDRNPHYPVASFMTEIHAILRNEQAEALEKREARDLVRLLRAMRKTYLERYERWFVDYHGGPLGMLPRPTDPVDLSLPDDPDNGLPLFPEPIVVAATDMAALQALVPTLNLSTATISGATLRAGTITVGAMMAPVPVPGNWEPEPVQAIVYEAEVNDHDE